MRILFLSNWFPYPPDNGSKIRAAHLLRELSTAHKVTAVAFCPPEEIANGRMAVPHHDQLRVHTVSADPFRHVRFPSIVRFVSPIPVAFWSRSAMYRTLQFLAVSESWDAIVAFHTPTAQYALRFPKIPRVLDIDTSSAYRMVERHRQQTQLPNRIQTWLSWQKSHQYEKWMIRRFHACTVASPRELSYLSSLAGQAQVRITVSPNGVDCRYNYPGLAQPKPYTLIYNGALTYSANYEAMRYFLAEIYPGIRNQQPQTTLTITGSIKGVDLASLQLDDSVHFSGYLNDIRPSVAGSAVCVVPILQGGGTRIKILEAMALGTPIVSTSKGAEGLKVIDGRHILLADDPASFIQRTVDLLQNPVLRQQLSSNAHCLVEQEYDWAKIGQQFVALVEGVIHDHMVLSR